MYDSSHMCYTFESLDSHAQKHIVHDYILFKTNFKIFSKSMYYFKTKRGEANGELPPHVIHVNISRT